jgi:GTP cyclohydrolase II
VYFPEKLPRKSNVSVIDAEDVISPFGEPEKQRDYTFQDMKNIMLNHRKKLTEKLIEASKKTRERVNIKGKDFDVEHVIEYPMEVDGKVFNALLLKVYEGHTDKFQTVRVVWQGDPSTAFWRVDSICRNGVEGGDGHCDCPDQEEREMRRWKDGESNVFVSMREHEGRGHGEGAKGGTLQVQRQYLSELGIDIGNSVAAKEYYKNTGKKVDERDFGPGQAVVRYLLNRWGLSEIPKLVTNNTEKIAKIKEVTDIGEVIDADVASYHLTHEAHKGLKDKYDGRAGTIYIRHHGDYNEEHH